MQSLEQASNAELLTSITGPKPALLLLQRFGGLSHLAKASLDELQQLKGVGKAKAAAIRSAFLLAQRLSSEAYPEQPLLDTPERVADILREANRLYVVEHFQVALLNTRRRLIGFENLAQGTLDSVVIHPREVFAAAITRRASAIILVHNHPSGNLEPSADDILFTKRVRAAAEIVGVELLDHLIVSAHGWRRIET